MIINIHDKNLNIIGVLDNSVQNAVHFDDDKLTEDLPTGTSVYEFTAFKNDFMRYETTAVNPFDSLVVGNWISFKHGEKEYLLKIVDTERKSNEVYVYAEDLILELRNENTGEFSTEDEKTIEEYIKDMRLINYTGLSIRVNEAGTLKKALSFSNAETKLARLLALFKEFGVEHEFTLKLKPNGKIQDFYVDIYLPRDNSTGDGGVGGFKSDTILREGKEIKTIAEKQNILEIWNRTRPIGKNTVTRVEVKDAKTATVAKEAVVVSGNMVNSNGTLSIENIQTILKLCYEYRLLPSGVISQLYLESFWGNSNVARVDNNWSGMTWTGNGNRPSGVVVTQGSARPSGEGGYYMHFANMSDFFKDYFYLLAKQGIYKVANATNISDYTKGLFRIGGATYDYAAAGYDHYNSLMTGIRNGINKNNSNVLDTYDNQWLNPNIVTSTTIEIASAGKTKAALDELGTLVGKGVGNGQCYAVPAWFSYKLGGAGLGCGLGGFSGLIGSGVRAADIGTDYSWSNFGWGLKVSGFNSGDIFAGAIVNIRGNYGAPWHTGYYGHTVVVESTNGDTMTVIQQNYAGKQYLTRDNYSISQVLPSIQSIVYTPELTNGGRVSGGNKVVKEDVTERYVNVELPTEVKTTEETLDIYISQDTFREYFDDNGVLEFRVKDGYLDAVQSVDLYPSQFASQDGGDQWIRRDFEYKVSSEEELIEKALADIKENCYPKIDFDVEGYFDGKIGDTFLIESPKFTPQLNLKARIVSKETSFTRPENSKTTFANYIKLKSQVADILQQRLEAILEAKTPYEIRVTASNGTSFKNNEGSSIISVQLLKSGIEREGKFIFKNGESIIGEGEKLEVKATDFNSILNMTIEAYVDNTLVATKPLTFTDIEDGKDGEQGPQGPKGDKGADGIAGKDGVGLKSTVVTYGLSTSETTQPTNWTSQVPTLVKGQYLWTKTVWTYTDNTSETGYTKTYIAKDGNDGNDGIAGKDGVGIKTTIITYASSTSGTNTPTGGWTSAIPVVSAGNYLWTKTVWNYTDNTSETGYSVAKMGEQGPQGPKGDKGNDGIAGKDGKGITGTTITYGISASETTQPTNWTASVPTLVKGQYLWTRNVWTYTDNTKETGYTKTYIAKDGNNGTDGIAGKDGVGILSTDITYQAGTSGTSAPTSTWTSQVPSVPSGQYLWTKTVWTYTDGTSETGYSVAKMGADGVGHLATWTFYKLSNSTSAPQVVPIGPSTNLSHLGPNNTWTPYVVLNGGASGFNTIDFDKIAKSNIIPDRPFTWFLEASFDGVSKFNGSTDFNIKFENWYVNSGGSNVYNPLGTRDFTASKFSDTNDTAVNNYFGQSITWTVPRAVYDAIPDGGFLNLRIRVDRFTKLSYHAKNSYVTYGTVPSDTTKRGLGNYSTYGWKVSPETVTQTLPYLWMYQVQFYDSGKEVVIPPTLIGAQGSQGIQGLQGPKGDQGIQGPVGADGKTQYTHIAYADNATGGGFSQTDQNKAYIGMYVDFTATDSTDPTKYKWSKWQGDKGETGAQGVPGPKGIDGQTPYLHIAYANSADGRTDFSTSNTSNKRYLGTYTDYTQADSTDPTKYKWVDMIGTVKVGGNNLIVKSTAQKGVRLGPSATPINDANHVMTDWIKVEPSTVYALTTYEDVNEANMWYSLAFYSTNASDYSGWISRPTGSASAADLKGGKKYTSPANASYAKVSYPINYSKVKFERGNIATDYSQSPEDTQADIDSKADQGFTTQQLNELRERQQLQQKDLEAKALQDDLEKWYQEYLNYVKLDTGDKQKSEQDLLALSERIVGINNDLGTTKERWSFLDNYMEAGNEGLVVGKKDGTANIKISDDRISMFSNGSEVMWITQNMLHIDNGVFTKTLQIGKYRFEEYGDNSEFLVIRYLGGN